MTTYVSCLIMQIRVFECAKLMLIIIFHFVRLAVHVGGGQLASIFPDANVEFWSCSASL